MGPSVWADHLDVDPAHPPSTPAPTRVERNRFYQFQWRPRPPTLLTPEKQKAILKNLKHYSKKYDEEDEAILMQARSQGLMGTCVCVCVDDVVCMWGDWVVAGQALCLAKEEWVVVGGQPSCIADPGRRCTPQADTEFLAAREKQMDEWREWQATRATWAAEEAEARKSLLGDRLRDDDFTVQLAEVTVVLEVKEETVKL